MGEVMGVWAAVVNIPTTTNSAASTFSLVGGEAGGVAGWTRNDATMAWTSASLRLRNTSEGMMISGRPL